MGGFVIELGLKFIAFAITRRASGVKGFKTGGGTVVLGGAGAANRRIVLSREIKKASKMWVTHSIHAQIKMD